MLPSALRAVCALFVVALLSSCSTTSTNPVTATSTNAYAAAYQSAKWASGVSVNFPSSCSMTVSATGVPYAHQAYYLVPVQSGGTVVATTPSGIQLGVMAYAGTGLSNYKAITATFNICPAKASATTPTSGGAIGLILSGTALFDSYEATQTVALSDNASYTFTTGGTTYTAYFLDPCNQHTAAGAGGSSGSTWHYHGNPNCWTSVVDGATGASHIIGIALDGFPIYGGRDINGNIVDPTTLDACNGITSATPEFPSGAYHYVLPITSNGTAVATKQSSINCYAGTVSATLSAQMKALGCKMPYLLANGKARLPDGREVSRAEAAVWIRKTMSDMQMGSMPGMQTTADMQVAKRHDTVRRHGMGMPGM